MVIKVPDDFLAYEPFYRFSATKDALTAVTPPSAAGAEGMPAAQELLALYARTVTLLNLYAGLVEKDAERMRLIAAGFKRSDS